LNIAATTYDHQEISMKTQSSKPHTSAVAVQLPATFPKEDRMKKQSSTTLKLAIFVAMVITLALSAGAQTVYMVSQDNTCGNNPLCDTNTLWTFPYNTPASAVQVGVTGAEIRGLAFDNYNNTVYGITAQGELVTVNTANGTTSPPLITLTSTSNEWSGLAFNGQNTLYAVNAYGNSELVAIDLGNMTWSVIGSTVYTTSGGQQIPQQILGLAYSASGVLYGSDRNIDNVVTISTQNAAVGLPYPSTAGINNLQEIGFDPSGNLYAVYDHQSSSNNAGFASFNFTSGTATEVGGLPFQIDFNGCPGCGNGAYGAGGFAFASACLAPPSNMIAWYPLDVPSSSNNNQQPDLVNNNNAATSYGSPRAASIGGEVSGALSFNGTSDYLKAADLTKMDIGASQDLSFDVWVKISSLNHGVVSIVDKRQASPLQGYQFFLYNDLLGLQLADGNGSQGYDNYVSTTAVPANNQWHLIAVTVQRSSTTCGSTCGTWYLDGNAVGTFDPTAHPGSLSSSGAPLMIGAQEVSLGLSEFLNGGLDELEIFNRALSASEVHALYHAGAAGKCK
jgi:hypothetical protein